MAPPCSVVLRLEETSTLPLREGANACEIAWNSCQQIFGRKNTVPNYRSATELARQAEACVADAAWPLLIPFYAAAKADAIAVERWHPRESADSLAENLAGELDKARQWARETGFSGKKNAPRSPLAEPEGALEWMAENYPDEASRFTSFWQWPASIRSEFEQTDGKEKP